MAWRHERILWPLHCELMHLTPGMTSVRRRSGQLLGCVLLTVFAPASRAQQPAGMPSAPLPAQTTTPAPSANQTQITLTEAINRARVNEPAFASAVAAQKNAALDRSIARAA